MRILAAAVALVAMAAQVLAGGYAARDDPFRYAGEYRDPSWTGTYLRARWYHSGLPGFVSRDPAAQQLSHYGYGSGNPLMRVDPTGASYRTFSGGLGRAVGRLNAGLGGRFARLFLGQFLVPLQIAAQPSGFWRAVRHDTGGVDVFLAAGVVVEAASYVGFYSTAARTMVISSGRRFSASSPNSTRRRSQPIPAISSCATLRPTKGPRALVDEQLSRPRHGSAEGPGTIPTIRIRIRRPPPSGILLDRRIAGLFRRERPSSPVESALHRWSDSLASVAAVLSASAGP